MLYEVYWRDKNRNVYKGYVKANSHKEAYDSVKLQDGYYITAVYKAVTDPTPQSLCINFKAPDYEIFG